MILGFLGHIVRKGLPPESGCSRSKVPVTPTFALSTKVTRGIQNRIICAKYEEIQRVNETNNHKTLYQTALKI